LKDGRAESTKYALFSIIGGVLWVVIAYFIYFFNNLPLHMNALISTGLYILLAVITYSFFDKQLELDKRVKTNDFPYMYQPPKKQKK
jgi:membrane protein DedA with SNARE-associated domain